MPFLTLDEKILIFVGLWFLILAIPLFIATIKNLLDIKKHSSDWVSIKATIYKIDKYESWSKDSKGHRTRNTTYRANIEYQVNDITYQKVSPISDSGMRVGDLVNIKYNKTDPNKIVSKNGQEYKFGIAFSIIALFVGVFCAIPPLYTYFKDSALYKNGIYIESTDYEIQDANVSIGDIPQYRLIVFYTNEDGKEFMFVSKETSKKVLQKVLQDPIRVYVDSTHKPTKNYIVLETK